MEILQSCDTLCAVARRGVLNFSFLAELLRKICKSIFAYFVTNYDPMNLKFVMMKGRAKMAMLKLFVHQMFTIGPVIAKNLKNSPFLCQGVQSIGIPLKS